MIIQLPSMECCVSFFLTRILVSCWANLSISTSSDFHFSSNDFGISLYEGLYLSVKFDVADRDSFPFGVLVMSAS